MSHAGGPRAHTHLITTVVVLLKISVTEFRVKYLYFFIPKSTILHRNC